MSRRAAGRSCVQAVAWLAALLGAPTCWADGPWSGSVAVTTDYVLRGVSQSYGGAALQAGLNYQNPGGWFAGAWGSNVDPYPFATSAVEFDLYTGYGVALSPDFTARASYTRYVYAWDRRPKRYDYGEFAATVAYRDLLAATVSYQPDSTRFSALGYAAHKPAAAYELTARWPLPAGFALVGGGGYYDLTRLYGVGYWSGSAGLGVVRGRFELDVTRFFSDHTVRRLFGDASADGRWVASVVWRF